MADPFTLQTTATFSGREWKLRTDFRDVLTVCAALNDPDLNEAEKARVILTVMYPEYKEITDPEAAIREAMQFINLGEPVKEQPKRPKLMDWEQDFKIIAPAVDKVLGYSCRSCEYLHWWEFEGAYREIGDGLFSTVISIRKKLAKHRKLEKYEREFLEENRDLVKLKTKLTAEEQRFLDDLD